MKILRYPVASFEARHRYRREVLEALARENQWLPLGAANRTEWMVGWFVPGGIDDLAVQPIKGLYKTQVRQIGKHLDIPRPIMNQTPSPDMMRGITDEFALGVKYWKIDLVLDYLEGGLQREEVRKAGCSEAEIQLVSRMKELSAKRRTSRGETPPVDGTLGGGLRVDENPPKFR
jgi:NAD+ synthase